MRQAYAIMPQTFTDVIELLVPELRRRGLFWDDYCIPGGTYRENAYEKPGQAEPLPGHPAAAMIWRPPKSPGSTTNGVNGIPNGHSINSHCGDDVEVDEEALDPMSMQFS
jgi:hypothetical protein